MEKTMKIFECNINATNGEIHHNVHADWDDKGNLHFTEHDLGEGVKGFWGRDEYEYFFTIDANDVPKFILCALWRGFTFEERMSVADLRNLCDTYDIKYQTDSWF